MLPTISIAYQLTHAATRNLNICSYVVCRGTPNERGEFDNLVQCAQIIIELLTFEHITLLDTNKNAISGIPDSYLNARLKVCRLNSRTCQPELVSTVESDTDSRDSASTCLCGLRQSMFGFRVKIARPQNQDAEFEWRVGDCHSDNHGATIRIVSNCHEIPHGPWRV